MNKTLYFSSLFIFLLCLQVLVLNNILFYGYINPYLYISFIFLYPLKNNRYLFLFLSFLLGLFVDFFSGDGGIHAFATLFIAYIRLFFIRIIFQKNANDNPFFKLKLEPIGKAVNYVTILTVIHHFILFSFANFSFNNFIGVLSNTLFSSIFTIILYFTSVFIFNKKQ